MRCTPSVHFQASPHLHLECLYRKGSGLNSLFRAYYLFFVGSRLLTCSYENGVECLGAWYGKHEGVCICSQSWHGRLQAPADLPNLHLRMLIRLPQPANHCMQLCVRPTHMSCQVRFIAVADQLDMEGGPFQQRFLTAFDLHMCLTKKDLMQTTLTPDWYMWLCHPPYAAGPPVSRQQSRRCAEPFTTRQAER